MNTAEILQQIGLTPKEAQLYLASLQLGPSSVLSLAKTAKMHRPMLYRLLERLVDEGIMLVTLSGKRKLYAAIEPKQLVVYLKQKESLLREALPAMLALSAMGTRKPKIEYYEGPEQLRNLYRLSIESHPKEILTYFPSKYMAALFGKSEMVEVINERIKQGIHTKTLRSHSTEIPFEGSEEREAALREARYLTEDIELGMGIIIANEAVCFFSPIEEDFGMRIESSSFAKLMRQFFMGLWKQAKK
ncbi:MAG: helix-turn-helix domain-containing protein [Candidatus Berkelbacteria bacterium]|nr:helix-turn-helix domain-containing protein [Candidatus Berkelbacteria bacterium]